VARVCTGSIDITPSAHSSHEGPVDAFPPIVVRFALLKDSNWHVEGGESRQLGVVKVNRYGFWRIPPRRISTVGIVPKVP